MTIDVTKLAKVQAIKDLAERVQTRLEGLENGGTALKGASLVGNQLSFFTTTDTSTTPAYTFNLQTERFLDDDATNFVPNFTFDSTTYVGATDPNLDGKPVMVLGLKTISNDGVTETLSYAFIDVSHLVDTYTASDTSIIVSGYNLKVNISADSDNMLANTATGLYVDGSGKVDKVRTAVEGNLAAFDSDGGIFDSGYSVAADTDVLAMLDAILGTTAQPLQITFPAEIIDSDTVLSTMLIYQNVPASVDKTIHDFTYNSSSQQFAISFRVNSNNIINTKTFTINQMPLGFNRVDFVFNDDGVIVERNADNFGNGGLGYICDWLNITLEYFVSCIKDNKYLKFLATVFNGVTYNYRESKKAQTITYDDDTDSMIITAVNADIDHIYLLLSQCKLLADRGAGTISDGVTQTASGSTFKLVFEKSK